MFTISRKVSFSVVVALLLGWSVMSFLIFQSSQVLLIAESEDGSRTTLPSGVKLSAVVDKKVYGAEEPILISLRNDSRKQIWLAKSAGGCPNTWWHVERLGSDATSWQEVALTRAGCPGGSTGLELFAKHSLKTGEWNGLTQTGDLGEIFDRVPTGTYRIAVPYLVGKQVTEEAWQLSAQVVPTSSFTIQ